MKKYLIVLMIIIILLISSFLYLNNKKVDNATKIPIITFHRLVPSDIKESKYKENVWVGSVDIFESMMKYIYDNRYKTISTDELYRSLNNEIDLPRKSVMITFDDGFYEDYYLVYPILKKYNLKAVSFVVGSRIKEITDDYDKNNTGYIGLDKINEIRNDYPNFEIESHSYNLHYYTKDKKHAIKSKNREELIDDINNNSKYNFNVMAYPFGDYNNIIKDVLKESGYKMAFRFTPSRYATKDCDIYEVPRIKIDGTKNLNYLKKWLD